MSDQKDSPRTLRPQELEAVYAISQAVASAIDTQSALDEIIRLVRPVFIFDNVALFEQHNGSTLDTKFARAIGRGRTKEADLGWGEATANQVIEGGQTIIRVEKLSDEHKDRTNIRHFIGLPLRISGQYKGALVFIRFGGPNYESDQIHLAKYIANHISQLLERQRLVEQIASLEARRRLDSLQADFVAMVTHELLTPLGFIKGYSTTLLREDTTWDEATRKEFLAIIAEEADRLHELIGNLMDTSRLQSGTLKMTFQSVRLDTLLKEVILRAQSLHEGMQITLQSTAPGLTIEADPTRLAQVFDNIFGNAAKYASGSPIEVTVEQNKGLASIAIKDYGPGVQPEHLEQIFQRFYRAPQHVPSARGAGLGLYICRKIMEAHQGTISATSHPGKGMTFVIQLPSELRKDQNSDQGGRNGDFYTDR